MILLLHLKCFPLTVIVLEDAVVLAVLENQVSSEGKEIPVLASLNSLSKNWLNSERTSGSLEWNTGNSLTTFHSLNTLIFKLLETPESAWRIY
ncbi:hypothetical protein WICPIJ_009052 [Wickerhamomyces pijperi]|uniref:Secreted protein n=1 Tax=Wickerhamomyces pijperi TaxID=599730 RepID=A0A9P8TFJ7_WICPI|nr:hypothetical protein WICPIJ_009052 [Wickerhamomyces pijperi]